MCGWRWRLRAHQGAGGARLGTETLCARACGDRVLSARSFWQLLIFFLSVQRKLADWGGPTEERVPPGAPSSTYRGSAGGVGRPSGGWCCGRRSFRGRTVGALYFSRCRAGCTRSSACLTRTMASRFRFGRVRGKAPRRGGNASAGAALHGAWCQLCEDYTHHRGPPRQVAPCGADFVPWNKISRLARKPTGTRGRKWGSERQARWQRARPSQAQQLAVLRLQGRQRLPAAWRRRSGRARAA